MTEYEALEQALKHHPTIWKAFLENARESVDEGWWGSDFHDSCSPFGAIGHAFSWINTPQGGSYWRDICDGILPPPENVWIDVFGVVHDNETK